MTTTPEVKKTDTGQKDELPVAVMTLMVRDEIDIIGDWLDYHLGQGLCRIIVTDNASADGTYELLRKYADADLIDLHQYVEHDKQQAMVVTGMAREAFTRYGADWVLNSDADEFWVTEDGSPLIHELAKLPREGKSYPVLVRNLFGQPLERGFSFDGAIYRDERPESELWSLGIHSHPTQNLIHPGSAEVEVSQGNHFSNVEQAETLPEDVKIEVLHFQVRSWEQYSTRVTVTGEGYARSPQLTPSPKHHTMRDYRWLRADLLRAFFAARHPQGDSPSGFSVDRRVADRLPKPNPLRAESPASQAVPMRDVDEALSQYKTNHNAILALEAERINELSELTDKLSKALHDEQSLQHHNQLQHERIALLEQRVEELDDQIKLRDARIEQERVQIEKYKRRTADRERELEELRQRKVVRYTDKAATAAKRILSKLPR